MNTEYIVTWYTNHGWDCSPATRKVTQTREEIFPNVQHMLVNRCDCGHVSKYVSKI